MLDHSQTQLQTWTPNMPKFRHRKNNIIHSNFDKIISNSLFWLLLGTEQRNPKVGIRCTTYLYTCTGRENTELCNVQQDYKSELQLESQFCVFGPLAILNVQFSH